MKQGDRSRKTEKERKEGRNEYRRNTHREKEKYKKENIAA